MKSIDYIRAWKDPEYRSSLSAEQRACLPEHPCAEIELSDEALGRIAGGEKPITAFEVCGLSCLCTAIFNCD